MNIQRFHALTSREALAKARMAFGDGTLILSNRPTATGVEVVATTEDSLATLDLQPTTTAQVAAATKKPQRTPVAPSTQAQVEDDAEQLAMSTLSFQDYVRERTLQRRQETLQTIPAPAQVDRPSVPRLNEHLLTAQIDKPVAPKPLPKPVKSASAASQAVGLPHGLVDELHAMKEMMEERFNTLSWLGQAKQHPIQSNLMLKLIRSGYSAGLARTILDKLPEDTTPHDAIRWMMSVLERNLKTDANTRPLHEQGGIYALVGATGVGKTTTTAKLAGLCARLHGPASVGLITLDTYRIGAHEQLRAYGRLMGVVAHQAHDRAALQDLLNLLGNKKMILIDTTGLAPRDSRKREMLDVLDLPVVNRLLVLNAVGHGDTQDEVVSSFRSAGVQQAVLSKIDEAVKLGPVLDVAIRHQLVLRGVTTGQKVPEDWEAADAAKLVSMSMRSAGKSAFDPQISDLGFFLSQPTRQQQGRIHA